MCKLRLPALVHNLNKLTWIANVQLINVEFAQARPINKIVDSNIVNEITNKPDWIED